MRAGGYKVGWFTQVQAETPKRPPGPLRLCACRIVCSKGGGDGSIVQLFGGLVSAVSGGRFWRWILTKNSGSQHV